MRQLITMGIAFLFSATSSAQQQQQPGTSMDSLKRSLQQVGNLFKKPVTYRVTIMNIDSANKDLLSLQQQLQQMAGLKKIKSVYTFSQTVVWVPFKGKATDIWANVNAANRKNFALVSQNDTALVIQYQSPGKQNSVVKNPVGNKEPVKPPVSVTPSKTAQAVGLSKAAALLFLNVPSRLTIEQKNSIVKELQFLVSKDGKMFYSPGAEEYPFGATVYPTDLNNDGAEELFVSFGNSFTSGMTGSSIVLLIPDKNGKLVTNLGFPGTVPDVLPTKNAGYPDLIIGGPGFEFPVWRWNGKEYDFFRKIKEKELLATKYTNIEDVSRKYCASIK